MMITLRQARIRVSLAFLALVVAAGTVRAADEPAPAPAQAKTAEQLVQDLKSPSATTFKAAVEALKAQGAGAVPALVAALKDPNPDQRGHAAAVLAYIGPQAKDATGALAETLAD